MSGFPNTSWSQLTIFHVTLCDQSCDFFIEIGASVQHFSWFLGPSNVLGGTFRVSTSL